MKYILIILSITSVLFYSSCGEDYCDEGVIFLEETVTFYIVDEGNNKDLITELNIYHKDSVKLLIDGINILNCDCGSSCQFQVDNRKLDLTVYNDSLYYLYLNVNEIDTIQMYTVSGRHSCLGVAQSEPVNFIYNGDTLFSQTEGNKDFIRIKK